MEGQTKKKGLKEYLDSVVSDEGLRTDIKITITNDTLMKVSATLIGTALIICIMVRVINGRRTVVAGVK